MSKDINIHVGAGFDAVAKRVANVWHRAECGEAVESETHITVETWESLAAVLTTKRFELLRHLHRHPETSVAALARSLGRDYKRVYEDVEALTGAGLIDRDSNGLRADYNEIRTVIAM